MVAKLPKANKGDEHLQQVADVDLELNKANSSAECL